MILMLITQCFSSQRLQKYTMDESINWGCNKILFSLVIFFEYSLAFKQKSYKNVSYKLETNYSNDKAIIREHSLCNFKHDSLLYTYVFFHISLNFKFRLLLVFKERPKTRIFTYEFTIDLKYIVIFTQVYFLNFNFFLNLVTINSPIFQYYGSPQSLKLDRFCSYRAYHPPSTFGLLLGMREYTPIVI